MQNRGFIIFAALLLFQAVSKGSFSQGKTPEAQRAEYLLYIIDHITWPDDSHYDTFTIGVLEKDEYLFSELTRQANDYASITGKDIKVISFSSIDEMTQLQMLYFNRNQGFDLDRVLRGIRGKGTLLVSENYPFQSSMINFVIVNNILRFEINMSRIEAEGFLAEPLFAALAVQNRADWSKLYLEAESRLLEEQEVVEEQSKLIRQQEQEIFYQDSLLDAQEKRLREQDLLIREREKEIALQTKRLTELDSAVRSREREIEVTLDILEERNRAIAESEKNIARATERLQQKEKEAEEQEEIIATQDRQIYSQLQEIEKHRIVIFMGALILLALVGLVYFVYRSYKIKKRANTILEKKNAHIRKQNIEIDKQRQIATFQRDTIAEQKQHIQDSITYASRIQEAVLPPEDLLEDKLKNYFLLNKPKEIVSGDYYWIAQKGDQIVVSVADCTGHGVPGAFMSMLGVAFLNEIVNKVSPLKANDILNLLRNYVIKSLRQTGKYNEAQDGMDIALCILNKKTFELQYAGANNPLYIIRPGKNKEKDTGCENIRLLLEENGHTLYRIKADTMPVAIHRRCNMPFVNHSVKLAKEDVLYLFSDGYIDQFGGEEGNRYSTRRFNQTIMNIQQDYDLNAQRSALEEELNRWRSFKDEDGNEYPQLDDIVIMGIRL